MENHKSTDVLCSDWSMDLTCNVKGGVSVTWGWCQVYIYICIAYQGAKHLLLDYLSFV